MLMRSYLLISGYVLCESVMNVLGMVFRIVVCVVSLCVGLWNVYSK